MNKRSIILSTILTVSILSGVTWFIMRKRTEPNPVIVTSAPSVVVTPTTKPELDPMAIEAIRTRSYPGSGITTERSLGVQSGGYTNAVVSYRSDGLKIYALMSTPAGAAPAGGWPVIILDHGYINPADYRTTGSEYQGFIAAFTRAGYMVVKPDYRGHGSSEGVPEGGHFSPVYAYDNLNLVASLKQNSVVNPARIGLFGHSLGGHVALRTAVSSRDIKATVLMAGVVGSFEDLFYNWPNSPMPNDRPAIVQTNKQNLVTKYGDPRANPVFWQNASALNYVKDIVGPIQVNHDAGDSTVPKLFSDHLVSALQSAQKPVEYHVYPGDDHQFSLNRVAFLNNVLSFYKVNL